MGKVKIEVWKKVKKKYSGGYYNTVKPVGYISRSPLHQRQFGNWGAIEYSIGGKRFWSVGGKEVTLPNHIISKLKKRGELKNNGRK